MYIKQLALKYPIFLGTLELTQQAKDRLDANKSRQSSPESMINSLDKLEPIHEQDNGIPAN